LPPNHPVPMEFLTIFLASLITLVSPTGTVVDTVAQRTIRSQFTQVESLQVRIDNAPAHQLLQGRVERVRLAGRGLFLRQDIRLDTLELETDSIAVNFRRRGKTQLIQPLQIASRMVLTEADLNRALASPTVTNWLKQVGSRVVLGDNNARRAQRFEFLNPQIKLLESGRFQLLISLREINDPARLDILIETGLAVDQGRELQLVEPKAWVNNVAVADPVIDTLTSGFPARTDLRQLERTGVLARILNLKLQAGRMEIISFVQVAAGTKL